jgi:putative RecB family exonuclease
VIGIPIRQLSYTYLHTLPCPLATFYKYEGGLRTPMTYHLALGNAVHLSLEKVWDNKEEIAPLQVGLKLFLDEFNRIMEEDEVFVTYPQLKKSQALGAEMIERYYNHHDQGLIPNPKEVEQSFRLPIEGLDIVGKIDVVEEDAEGLVVVDYKTGSSKPDEWFLRRSLQFTAYAWACRELYGVLPYKVVWHHLRTGSRLASTRDEWDIEQLKRVVRGAMFLQDNNIRYRVYHEQVCGWCPFAGSVCDDTKLEEKIAQHGRDWKRYE